MALYVYTNTAWACPQNEIDSCPGGFAVVYESADGNPNDNLRRDCATAKGAYRPGSPFVDLLRFGGIIS